MAKDYIEREAILRLFEVEERCGYLDVGDIHSIPAADVVEVVHGRWIPFHSQVAGYIQYCSACEIGCTWQPNYCPNCGARMDGDSK